MTAGGGRARWRSAADRSPRRTQGTTTAAAGTATALVLVAVVAAAACFDGGPSDPGQDRDLEVLLLAGDEQFAEPGATLRRAFEVLVRSAAAETPREGVQVEWEVLEGSGASLSRRTSFTDASGRARSTLTLGPVPGTYRVRAAFPDVEVEPLDFRARAVLRPELTGIPSDPVTPGSEMTLEGRNFIPEVEQIDVLLSGIRAPVLSGTATTLRIRVPSCLNETRVPVVVGVGELRSDPMEVTLEGPAAPVSLMPGDVHRIDDPDAHSCALLVGGAASRYLAVVHSTSTVDADAHRYALVLRTGDDGSVSGVRNARPVRGAPRDDAGMRWERFLRGLAAEAVAGRSRSAQGAPAPAPPMPAPRVGDRRHFQVLNERRSFDEVDAEVRHVGERAVVYVDLEAPAGGLGDDDLSELGEAFDDPVHPTVTAAYGDESDLDGNGRIVILFTPAVNRLTETGDDGFIGGFFNPVDLLPEREGSNAAEVFYVLVPDPAGEFGAPRSRDEILATVPSVLAHELQHMVHFNQRVLVRGAERMDAVWLREALATTAEDLVAEELVDRGSVSDAVLYGSGNRERARRFLSETHATSLVASEGAGTLEERGAGWLFLKYLRGLRSDRILGELTRTTRTGTGNVTATMGEKWDRLLTPWAGALYLDGLEVAVGERYRFEGFDLRRELEQEAAGYPLDPPVLGSRDATVLSEVRSSSAAYTILTPAGETGVAVNLAGPDGGALAPLSGLGLSLIRLR